MRLHYESFICPIGGIIPGAGEVPDTLKPEKTTAKPPPAITTPAPTPYGSCALPLNPASDAKATYHNNGYRFGMLMEDIFILLYIEKH